MHNTVAQHELEDGCFIIKKLPFIPLLMHFSVLHTGIEIGIILTSLF